MDHFNALPHLTEQFSIGVVYVTLQMAESPSPAVQRLFAKLKEQSVRVELISEGDELFYGSKSLFKVLGPPAGGNPGNDNSNSIVLLVEHLGRKVLLPGDLEQAGLSRLLELNPLDVDLVMAAHHGSQNSQPAAFMNWATPEYVVISGGSQRVSETTVKRFKVAGREIGRTDRDGAIRFSIDHAGVRFERWNSQPWK